MVVYWMNEAANETVEKPYFEIEGQIAGGPIA